MSAAISRFFIISILLSICAGCANITSPTGGRKDVTPPKLVSVEPTDSLLNTKPKKIELDFNEYITVSDVSKEVHISPILAIEPTVMGINKRVVIKIVDTLLEDNTTYRITFGSAIKDLHEGNVFAKYTYTFSTGGYFDSLEMNGTVTDAVTGLPGGDGVTVELYSAADNDSAVVRHKPKYVTKADPKTGEFSFKGLPCRRFRIYALKDANTNLIYDGPPNEMIAFSNEEVWPDDTARTPSIALRLFMEMEDTTLKKKDSIANSKESRMSARKSDTKTGLSYTTNIDSSDATKRTYDVNKPISIIFNKLPVLNTEKISVIRDSNGAAVPVHIAIDTSHQKVVRVSAAWKENAVYTLRLAKGFAKDTSDAEVMPARFVFRTFNDEDYGKIKVHLPSKFYFHKTEEKKNTKAKPKPSSGTTEDSVNVVVAPAYVLWVTSEKDTVYQKPITDTNIALTKLLPGKYTFRIIVDKNGNGKWDTGDLFAKLQPEVVLPFLEPLNLKAGWEHTIDYQEKPKQDTSANRKTLKPDKKQ